MKRIGKTGTIIALVFLVAIVSFMILQARSANAKDTELTFETSPLEVQIKIDDEQYGTVSSGDTITAPIHEQAEIEVSREGFRTYSSTVEVTPGAPHTVTAELHPETQEAQALLEEEHQGSLEQEVTEQYLEEAERAYQEYPILEQLPKHGKLFRAYQGLSDTSGNDFAIHLYLYEGEESQGREAFKDWLKNRGYHFEDYDIVEHIEDKEPPVVVPEEPSWNDLEELTPSDIEISDNASNEEMTAEEVAVLFAEIATTWDAAEDVHSTDGLKRATDLMTEDAAETIFTPKNPANSPTWREAAQYEARSVPWVTYSHAQQNGNETQVELDVCWAWVTEGEHVILDGPRSLEVRLTGSEQKHSIQSFVYQDPDPFVSTSDSACRPDDAPPAP